MGILWLLNVYPFGNGRGIAFLFFYVGAYMSLSNRQFAINGHKCYLCVAFFLSLVNFVSNSSRKIFCI